MFHYGGRIKPLSFTSPHIYDNEAAHQQLKQLMEQKKNLSVRLDDTPCAWISISNMTRLRYLLNTSSWMWITNYLETGNPDDFRVFPSLREAMPGFQVTVLKALLDTKRRIYKIPFLRETQSQLNLAAVFSFGKIYFRINRTAPIVEYLNAHNI